nr:disease resistance protein RGA2-like [Coffea arabica]
MAELIVPKIIDVLGAVAVKQFGEKVNLVMGVEEEVANISSKLATIEKVLHDAERRRLKEEPVGIWLEKLEDITYEMDDVLDEWNFKIHRAKNEGTHQNARIQPTLWIKVRSLIPSLCSCLKQVPVRSDIAQKIKKINEQLELTLKEADQFKFISSGGIPDSQDFKRIMSTSIIDESEIYGREADKNALLDQVLSKSSSQGRKGVQVISIVGVGGSGKTTLAQLLFNNDKVKNHFELRNWICVSDPFDQKRIAKAILENAGKSSQESELDPLIQRIKETFSGKRFLLVLDDVWTEEDSKLKPFKDSLKDGASGSVILVTTRSQRVARVMGSTHTHSLSLISDSDCWLIMQRIAFDGRSKDSIWGCKKVESIGEKIAKKCKGLPLAAKTMGSLLRFKDTVQQWQNILDSEICYNELSPELKHCFSYCAVFPKDHSIFVEELIGMWIAEGYVRPRRRGERLELVGREYFDNLAMRSFFQELRKVEFFLVHDFTLCKMHDIVHDFAQFLRKNELCHVLDGIDYEQGIGRNSSSERARHLTWLGTERTFSSLVVDFGRLRSFFCSSTWKSSAPRFVLQFEVREDPGFIKLSCLSQRIEGLVHLRHLFNFGTSESLQIPQGLRKLTSLCTLTQFIARGNSDDLAILKDLNQLERLIIHIHGEVDFGSAELGKKKNMREMSLLFSNRVHFIETPSCIESEEPPPNLQQLALTRCPGNELPSWLVTTSLVNNLTKLIINEAYNISSLPALWKLSSLEELGLIGVGKLECLSKAFFGITKAVHENSHETFDALSNSEPSSLTEAVAFPNLRKLRFSYIQNWTNWEDLSEDDEELAISIMPHLEELKIHDCEKVEILPHRILGRISSLKTLDIRNCFKLSDRYSSKTGDDWIKISHIPRVDISDEY